MDNILTEIEEKAEMLMNAMKYKVSDANSIAFIKLIQSKKKINSVKAEKALLLAKDIKAIHKTLGEKKIKVNSGFCPKFTPFDK
ncbi:hypothetical protein G9F72_005210 [Clostridium estertheticum]|uniref:hypothetical protein n=1 Tax=Clostridium estertheticum TaxID=238834 RepID=UPI0013E999A7|nr:hypothetical protein [Clostridium estertheticum]MBZ9685745.1 hypothetical protein [Clostridium estertheticum]